MTLAQSISDHEEPSHAELEHLELIARHWELKHHILHKALMSPAIAAALIACFGTVLTVAVGYENLRLQERLEASKEENTLIIEALKAEPNEPLSRLEALVNAGLLPTFAKGATLNALPLGLRR